jgi:heme exporter protein D
MQHFLHMGGYAIYVWPSYALGLLAVIFNVYSARRSLRQAQADVRRRHERARQMKTVP